jgi:hypothetical protein
VTGIPNFLESAVAVQTGSEGVKHPRILLSLFRELLKTSISVWNELQRYVTLDPIVLLPRVALLRNFNEAPLHGVWKARPSKAAPRAIV